MPDGYAGKDFLLKLGASNGTGLAPYVTVGGFRSNTLKINASGIDVTNKSNASWQTLIEGGIKNVAVDGDGVWNNDTAAQALLAAILSAAGTILNFQIVCADGDTFTGKFQVQSFQRTGPHDKEETFSISLASSGAIAFVAGA